MPLRLSPSIARNKRSETLNSLEVNFNFVDVSAFDLCSNMTVNGPLSVTSTARDNLQNDGYAPSGNANRPP